MKPERTFLNSPELANFVEEITAQYGIPRDIMEPALELAVETGYRDGYIDAIKIIMHELKRT